MSVFVLKLIAIGTMFVDHLAWFLYLKGDIGQALYTAMRAVGRISFPIFCFLLVNGFAKTSDRKRYLSRLVLFAAISQLPYSTFFNDVNFFTLPGSTDSFFKLTLQPVTLILVAGFVCVVWLLFIRRDFSVLPLALLFIMGVTQWEYNGIWLLNTKLNVFCTLAVGLAAMDLFDSALDKQRRWYETLLLALALALVIFFYGQRVDYGYGGIALLLLLYFGRRSGALQALAICLWSAYTYLYDGFSPVYAVAAALSVIPLLLYNDKLGRRIKWSFYIFYPLHLAILAVLIFTLK